MHWQGEESCQDEDINKREGQVENYLGKVVKGLDGVECNLHIEGECGFVFCFSLFPHIFLKKILGFLQKLLFYLFLCLFPSIYFLFILLFFSYSYLFKFLFFTSPFYFYSYICGRLLFQVNFLQKLQLTQLWTCCLFWT